MPVFSELRHHVIVSQNADNLEFTLKRPNKAHKVGGLTVLTKRNSEISQKQKKLLQVSKSKSLDIWVLF